VSPEIELKKRKKPKENRVCLKLIMEPEDWDLSGEDLDSLERDAYQKIAQLRSNPPPSSSSSHSPNPLPPSSSSANPPSLPQGARALPSSFKSGGTNNTNNNNGIYAFLLLHHLIYIIYFALYLLLVIMY
jgi:hypothetical protein